jgi:hypothetical protein
LGLDQGTLDIETHDWRPKFVRASETVAEEPSTHNHACGRIGPGRVVTTERTPDLDRDRSALQVVQGHIRASD